MENSISQPLIEKKRIVETKKFLMNFSKLISKTVAKYTEKHI